MHTTRATCSRSPNKPSPTGGEAVAERGLMSRLEHHAGRCQVKQTVDATLGSALGCGECGGVMT